MIFYLLYTLSGLSDIADGYVARKMKCASRNGEILDSIADIVFIIVMFWIIIPFIVWHTWICLWLAAIVLVRILSMAIRYKKYRKFASLHTVMNKASGLLLFLFVYSFKIFNVDMMIILLCCFTTFASIDELIRVNLNKC